MGELHDLTALEQGAAVARGEVSPRELADHYLDRAQRHSDGVGAYVTLTPEVAREQADRLAAELRDTGDGAAGARSPLHGVPVPVKDLNLTAGIRTTFGSAAFRDFVPDVDDSVVVRLRDAGTVLLGKTSASELGLPCYTEPDLAPPSRSPWAPDRMAGGSSGGAAAAVAAGLAPVAHGNDGGGSVRIPASCCGLVGLKPARGRVSGGPVRGDVSGLPCEGVLARTVRDAAALLDVMAGPTPGDPHWAPPLPSGESFLGHAGREPGRLRVARFVTPVIGHAAVHDECLTAYDRTTRLLTELGHQVEEIAAPFTAEVVPLFETVWSVLPTLAPVPQGREELLRPLTRWLRERGRSVAASDFALALATLQVLARRAVRAMVEYDAVLTPTLARPPLPVGALRDDDDPAGDFAAQEAFTPWTALWNLTGQPAVSLPLHVTDAGLPVGVMLAGRPAGEAGLLSLAAQVESAAGTVWTTGGGARPACW
ncbi:MAG TPA: amidase [Actinomycetes bacterium]|nr:amidase [Actinomycetes bacterium]